MNVFVEVAERGSLSAAADALDLSRAMVSRSLSTLEEWLGARLLHRTTRRISLTSAGEQALVRCRELLIMTDGLREALADRVNPTGHVRITCSPSFAQCFLAAVVAEFVSRYPYISLDMLTDDRTVDLVEDRIDLAIRMSQRLDPNLIARPLSVCRSVLCASADYLAKRPAPGRPEDLKAHDCLAHHFVAKNVWMLKVGAGTQAVEVTGRICANEASVLMSAVLAGAGIALLPTYLVRPHLSAGTLVEVLPDYPPEAMGIYGVYVSRRQMPKAVRAFLDFLASRLTGTPAWDI